MRTLVVKLVTIGATAAATMVARRAVEYGWRVTRHEEPPTDSDAGVHDDRQLRDLLLWSAILGGTVVVARKLAEDATEKMIPAKDGGKKGKKDE